MLRPYWAAILKWATQALLHTDKLIPKYRV